MFKINGTKIQMTEGDFGNTLPIEIEYGSDETIGINDNFKFSIYKTINTEPVITKTYTLNANNEIEFVLTKQESEQLRVGDYYYDLDWYSGETFLNNIIRAEQYQIVEKAGKVNED